VPILATSIDGFGVSPPPMTIVPEYEVGRIGVAVGVAVAVGVGVSVGVAVGVGGNVWNVRLKLGLVSGTLGLDEISVSSALISWVVIGPFR